MLKAVAITKFESAFGELTMAVTEENEIYFRAHEAAKLFGFSDTKGCLNQHVKNSELILMPTAGGEQPVKCISWEDVIEIGFKSRLNDKEDLLFQLSHFHKCVKVDVLERENALLKKLLDEALEVVNKSIDQTEKSIDILEKILPVTEALLAEQRASMNL